MDVSANELARVVMERIEALGRISEDDDRLTRTYGSHAMRKANDFVASWMRAAGMTVSLDAIGNIIGRYAARMEGAKTFMIGSHLDTVRAAGKFDGPLGVMIGIACVQHLHERRVRLPFALEVVGFADEEGVRFQTTYLGSKAMAGTLTDADLQRADAQGVTVRDAITAFGGKPDDLQTAKREAAQLLGYVEVHIEQGPVLEKKNLPVGVVTAIAGQTRERFRLFGKAGHAGTTPMELRHDALACAAEFILEVEALAKASPGLVATVGQIEALPGASNVIPGEVNLSLDVRHAQDAVRENACKKLLEAAYRIATKRGLAINAQAVHETKSVDCSRDLSSSLAQAVRKHLPEVSELASGAGHDAAVMAGLTPMAMLFVRCKGGISHHPDESVTVGDVLVAIGVMNDFLQALRD
jgi:allantoate deiminase